MLRLLRPVIFLLLFALSHAASAIESVDMKYANGADWTAQLRNGYILTTESSAPLHLPTMLGSDRFAPTIHLGVVEVTPAGIYVYDTTATFGKYFIGGRSPSDTMEGSVRRLSLADFVDYAQVFNIYSPPAAIDGNQMVHFLREHWINKTPFDPYFNLDDRSALYCSELVAMSMEYAGGPRIIPAGMRNNPSLDVMRRWMKISTPRFLFPYQFTAPRNWIGTISVEYSRQAIIIDRLVKYELYQRFTSDQKIGNIIQLDGTNLIIRKPIQRLSTIAHNLSLDPRFANASLDELHQVIRGIANETLGPSSSTHRIALPRCQLDPRSCAGS